MENEMKKERKQKERRKKKRDHALAHEVLLDGLGINQTKVRGNHKVDDESRFGPLDLQKGVRSE